jgi:ribonuclease D
LFDTQIAAAFCGFGEQVGYAALVEAICDIKLAKGYTRTAWCKRPLSTNQIAYALDDAKFLGILYEYLKRNLQGSQRLSWAQEEFDTLAGTDLLDASRSAAIEKISNAARGLTQVGQSIATALAKWREQAAMHCDQPRQWLLSNDQLLTIAAAAPFSVIELAQIDNVASEFCKRWGETVITVVECGRDEAVQFPVRGRPRKLLPGQKALDKLLWKELQKISDAAGLPPSLIARRDDIRALAAGKRDLLLLRGWRSEIAGKSLLHCIT